MRPDGTTAPGPPVERSTPTRVDVLSEEAYVLGEGVRALTGGLVFVDLLAGRLLGHPGEPGAPVEALVQLDQPLGAVAPVAGRPGEWVAATGDGLAMLSGDGSLRWVDRPEEGAATPMRVNDGVCDTAGRFWFGTTAYDESPVGSLYRYEQGGRVERVLEGVAIANGPAVSADGRWLFLADSGAGTITRYALDASGTLSQPVVIVREDGDAAPDGMTTDQEGTFWVAMFGGGEVRRYDADGTLLLRVAVPATQPTSVAVVPGGLVVTSATKGMADPGPADGRLLLVTLDGLAPPSTPVPVRQLGPSAG